MARKHLRLHSSINPSLSKQLLSQQTSSGRTDITMLVRELKDSLLVFSAWLFCYASLDTLFLFAKGNQLMFKTCTHLHLVDVTLLTLCIQTVKMITKSMLTINSTPMIKTTTLTLTSCNASATSTELTTAIANFMITQMIPLNHHNQSVRTTLNLVFHLNISLKQSLMVSLSSTTF